MASASVPFLIFSCVVGAAFTVVSAWCTYRYIKEMYSRPNERIIQINIDRNIFRTLWMGAFSVLMFFVFIAGIRWTEQIMFLNDGENHKYGWMGRDFLLPEVSMKEVGGCDHVEAEKTLVIFYPEEEPQVVLCGVSHRGLNDQNSFPYRVIDKGREVLIGKWPFSYKLSIDYAESNG